MNRVQHLNFVIKLGKKMVLKPSHQIEFLGIKTVTITTTLALTKGKMEKVNLKCQNLLSWPHSDLCFGIEKIYGFDFLNCPSSSASLSAAKIFTAAINIFFIPGLFTPGRDDMKQFLNFRCGWKI